jgi:hypothetical protein
MDLLNYQTSLRQFINFLPRQLLVIDSDIDSSPQLSMALARLFNERGVSDFRRPCGTLEYFERPLYRSVDVDIVFTINRLMHDETNDAIDSITKFIAELSKTGCQALFVLYAGNAFQTDVDSSYNGSGVDFSKLESLINTSDTCTLLKVSEVLVTEHCPLLVNWAEQLSKGCALTVSPNKSVSPVYLDDVLLSIVALMGRGNTPHRKQRVWEMSASDAVSYGEVARYLAEQVSASLHLVKADELIEKCRIFDNSSISLLIKRPLNKALMAVERWVASNLNEPVPVFNSRWDAPFPLAFVEKIVSTNAKKLFYEKLFYSPTSGYLIREMCDQLGIEHLVCDEQVIRLSHDYIEGKGDSRVQVKALYPSYYRGLWSLTNRLYSEFISAVNQKIMDHRSIVFVTVNWNSKLLAEAKILKRCGKRCYIIVLHGGDSCVKQNFVDTFEQVLEVPMACLDLLVLLTRRLRPDVFHICSYMMHNYISWAVVANSRAAKTIIDYDDFLLANGRLGFFDSIIDSATQGLDFETSHLLLEHADKNLMPFSPDGLDWLEDVHPGAKDNATTFFNWPLNDQLRPKRERPVDRPIRLVWAGNVWPCDELTRRFYYSSGLIETIKQLTKAGCEVDILLDPHKSLSMDDPAWAPYYELEKTGRFKFKQGVPFDKLHETLGTYDFGIQHFNWHASFDYAHPQKLEHMISNKTFSYISAGLPVLAWGQMGYLAWAVKTFGLGVVQEDKLDGNIQEVLRNFDFDEYSARVELFCEANNMGLNLSRLLPEYR